mmetsp:Transcript_11511/g.17344  ORF Transcript_11511/g.17344 Transcript_11511/m.17344 type:complete len:129 (+) Transcript_11511:112-498(+)|eukprot:CAMPEP_0194763776 /NCGR_PEP_ID=MMETSP0323_2-20130528/20514_1 /TAXON_ID=2866 ORGANISM="Crypthecodinium cohnii, Strain Seligo" /NCGR_SAMPLE_ID=MMETSP0323_2 /ASSEMBLY_ACC=CAM_ASM_000346 /LENGTH=128 /DNA_ID=CAMNT_0039689447 /DNA_START=67 /DNA_END=453 /DNA_ORIENTATION=-
MTDQVEYDDEGHLAGTHPPTMDDLRQECSMLRQRVAHLESEKSQLEAQVRDWKTWYAGSYRPQIEFLDSEISRLCAFAPSQKFRTTASPGSTAVSALAQTATTEGGGPTAVPPPGMSRNASDSRLRRK